MGGRYWTGLRGRIVLALAGLLALLALAVPAGAAAPPDSPAIHTHCTAYSSLDEPIAAIAADPARWRCGEPEYTLRPERALLRFAIDRSKPVPNFIVTRRSSISGLHLLAIDADGTMRRRDYMPDMLQPAQVGGFFKAPLPEVRPETQSMIVAFDQPSHIMTVQQAHLAPDDPGDNPSGRKLLMLLAALCGMLAMPLIYNCAFYRVLREPFVLWHSALTASLMATIVFNSGLSIYLADLKVETIGQMTGLAFGASVATGGMFLHGFIEPGKLHPFIRRALPLSAIWSVLISTLHAYFPFVLRPIQTDAYYAAYLPVLALFLWAVGDALARGSRSAKFQLVGWTPLLMVGAIRQISQLTPLMMPTDAMMLFYAGTVLEVLATTWGVADRFMTIKNQRDHARSEARVLERLSERDGLTGLLNRRTIEERFTELRTEGYNALAVIDLDDFKSVNDTFGHAVGDDVLRAVAEALQPNEDTLAVRMGGEEFLLLMRGDEAWERAERRRLAIPRLAAEHTRIDRLVTASMGLVEMPREAVRSADFATLYRRADQLLYEAKETGRNRTVAERMKLFRPRKKERRQAA